MKFGVAHPPTITSPVTYFSLDYASGVNSIQVKNAAEFAQNKYACLGPIGFQQAELLAIQSVAQPQTLNFPTNTQFSHNTDDRITLFDFNQIHVYKSITGINGSYSLNQTLNIDVSEDWTIYEDQSALSTYYYKTAYFNSAISYESSLSDPIAATGFVFHSLKTMTDRVLSAFGDFEGKFYQRDEVKDALNEFWEKAQQEYAIATKQSNMILGTPFTVQDNVETYPLPTDFLMEKSLQVSQDNGQTWPYKTQKMGVDSVGHVYQTNVLYGYWLDGSNIHLDPVPLNSSDQIRMWYVPLPNQLNLQTDTLSVPFQNASSMFVKYALGQGYLKDKKLDDWKALTDYADSQLNRFISFVRRMQNRHPQTTEIVDNTYLS